MKFWLKILLAVWMIGSVWYYLCQINHHCTAAPQKAESAQPAVSRNATVNEQEPERQEAPAETTEEPVQDTVQKVESGEPSLEEKLAAIEQSLSSRVFSRFNNNDTKIIPLDDADKIVEDILFYFQHKPGSKLVVTGHTDNTGSDALNYKLGKWRAKNVADFLIQKGVPADRIIIESKGETMPVAGNATAEGRKKNRRVEITIIH